MKKIVMTCFISFMLFGFFKNAYSSESEGTRERSKQEAIKTETFPEAERLEALGYLEWAPSDKKDEDKSGVILYDRVKSWSGINLFTSRPRSSAVLMDMKGAVIHKWEARMSGWQTAALDEKGDLYVLVKDQSAAKLNWNSEIMWKCKGRFHHFISIAENGDVYLLSRQKLRIPYNDEDIPILNDYIIVLNSQGELKTEYSLHEIMGHEIAEESLKKISTKTYVNKTMEKLMPDSVFDVFHTNTLKWISRDVPGLCKKGDVLICCRNLNLTAVVDLSKEKVRWSWGKEDLIKPHDPSLLENGNIMIFDNGSRRRKYSRALEVDPTRNEIVWEYYGSPRESFYSETRGAAQELPNGNILITESDKGRIFEITRSGKKVWEFYNPDVKKRRGKIVRAAVFRCERFAEETIKKIISNAEKAEERANPQPDASLQKNSRLRTK